MLGEMVLLGIIARKLYKRQLPELIERNNNIEQVYTSTHVTTIGSIMSGETPNQPITSEPTSFNHRF